MKHKFKPQVCPVCNDFLIQKHNETCYRCGWNYQSGKSLDDYKKWYERKLNEDPSFDFSSHGYEPEPHLCPVCGKHVFPARNSFDICPECGWEDDELMENNPNDWAGCANDLCLNEYRNRYLGSATKLDDSKSTET